MRHGTPAVPHRQGAVVAAALLALVGLGACDDAPAGETRDDAAPLEEREPVDDGVLELGRFAQARAFIPYAPGDQEEIEMGLQGGFHIFVDGRLRPDTEVDEVVVELVVTRLDDDSEVTRIRHQRAPDIPDADGWPTLPEMIIFIPDPASVAGAEVHIEAYVEAVDGTLLDIVDAELDLI